MNHNFDLCCPGNTVVKKEVQCPQEYILLSWMMQRYFDFFDSADRLLKLVLLMLTIPMPYI